MVLSPVHFEDELTAFIAGAPDQTDFNSATRKCEQLVTRYGKIKSILDRVLRALGWLKVPLMVAVPDAPRFQAVWFDHVAGVRMVVKSTLSAATA